MAYNAPKPQKVPPPRVEDLLLDLETAEVDVMDIIAPQHRKLRAERRAKLFKEIKDAEEGPTEQEEGEDIVKPKIVVVK